MSDYTVYVCDGCGTEERGINWARPPEGWSKVPGLTTKEDLCPACMGEFAKWKAAKAAAVGED